MSLTDIPARAVPRPRKVDYPTSDNEPLGETDLHRAVTTYVIDGLDAYFEDDPNVYVSGDNFIYYVEGNPRKVVSPDAYVVRGVAKHLRDIFKVWEEGGHTPDIAFEITSVKSRNIDTVTKFKLYQDVLAVPEYILFDPFGEYLKPKLQGWRLKNGAYQRIPLVSDRLFSEVLGIQFVIDDRWLRLIDPRTGARIATAAEARRLAATETLRAQDEAKRAQDEAKRAQDEAKRADDAERRIAELTAELERVRRGDGAQ